SVMMPTMGDGSEPVAAEEILYRRILASQGWYNLTVDPKPSRIAFHPTSFDETGLSVSRSKYSTAETTVRVVRLGKKSSVACLLARDLMKAGIRIEPKPKPDDPGHIELPELTYATRNESGVAELETKLATLLCLRVEGPFFGTKKVE